MISTAHRQPAARSKGGSVHRGTLMLAGWIVAVATVWLIVLPAIAERPAVKQRSDFYRSRGIDPSAMFYTELEATNNALAEWQRFHAEHPTAMWIP